VHVNRELDGIDEQLIIQPALLSYHVLTSRRGLPRLPTASTSYSLTNATTTTTNTAPSTPSSTSSTSAGSRTGSPSTTSGSSSSSRAKNDSLDSTTSSLLSLGAARLRHSRSMSAFLPASHTATSSVRPSGLGVDRDWNAEYVLPLPSFAHRVIIISLQ
jgi:hypothetical protein